MEGLRYQATTKMATAVATPGSHDLPFDAALREAHARLFAAHCSAIGTLEAELSRMRNENTLLRMSLAEAGLAAGAAGAAVAVASSPKAVAETTLAAPVVATVPAAAASVIVPLDVGLVRENTTVDLDVAGQQQQPSSGQATGPPLPRQQAGEPLAVVRKLEPSSIVTGVSAAGAPQPSREEGAKVSEFIAVVDGSPRVPDEGSSVYTVVPSAVRAVGPTLSTNKPAQSGVTAALLTPIVVPTPLQPLGVVSPPVPATLGAPVVTASLAPGQAARAGPSRTPGPTATVLQPPAQVLAPSADQAPVAAPSVVTEEVREPVEGEPNDHTSGTSLGKPLQPNHPSDTVDDLEASLAQHVRSPTAPTEEVASASTSLGAPMPMEKAAAEAPAEVIEVVTPGASALMAATGSLSTLQNGEQAVAEPSQPPVSLQVVQDLDRALESVLAFYGWQHLEVQKVSEGVYLAAGAEFRLRCDSVSTASDATDGPQYNLSASSDGGVTWESLSSLIRHRRLHKVVRTDPIASALDNPASPEAPISLADLARMPSRSTPTGNTAFTQNTMLKERNSTPLGGSSGYSSPHGGPSMSGPGPKHTGHRQGQLHNGLPMGPDGLPLYTHDGLPSFNNAFPTYFDALSGPTHYYNQFRIPDRRPQ